MERIDATLTGIAPIVFHNERLVDPNNEHTIALRALTDQRKKTPALIDEIRWVEWRAGWYEHDDRPVLPADNLLKAVIEGARKRRKGKDVEAGVIEADPHFYFEYEGPKTISKMARDARFCDYRSVVIGRNRVMRARPRLRAWKVAIALLFDPDVIDGDGVLKALKTAGERIGLCERRPRWGRFVVD